MNIKEFARSIGVSPTTVSAVLTGKGRISDSTREMVRRKMIEHGFTPNLNARRLVRGRSFLVALSHLDRRAASDLFTMQIARAIVQPLRSFGYDLMLDLAPDSMGEYKVIRQLVKSSTIDGTIVIGGSDIPVQLLNDLASVEHPCVVIAQRSAESIPGVGSVAINLRPGLDQTAKYLVDNGHHKIGFIDSDLRDEVSGLFAEAVEAIGVHLSKDNYVVGGRDVEEGAAALRVLMSRRFPPTAILARTDVLAVGALREARSMGLSIPDDLSIIGHDDLSLLSLIEPGLTTIRVNCTELAESAASVFHELLMSPDTVPAARVSDTCLMIRRTAGRAKAES
jgi:DNA-binding LacI/PurR family transcriptional regulator